MGIELSTGTTLMELCSDELVFNSPDLPTGPLTHTFARLFDPLHLFGPFHTLVKCLFHQLIPTLQVWDVEVSEEAAI